MWDAPTMSDVIATKISSDAVLVCNEPPAELGLTKVRLGRV